MIDLKRNSKKELVTAKGIRSRESSIYVAHQENDFKVSRSKFHDFLTCKRCFYLDRVKGLDAPGTPGWTLNETTDLLLKKEFDICRKNQIPHEIFKKNNIDYLIPFQHGGYIFDKRWFDRHAFDKAVQNAGIVDFRFHDLRHCAINNLRLAGNDHYSIKKVSGHKTDIAFQRYNLVTEEEILGMKWLDLKKDEQRTMDTYMDTKQLS